LQSWRSEPRRGKWRSGPSGALIDVLIAAFAIVHSCVLAHHDRHYELIREALPDCGLKTLVVPGFVED
jgi:predicted nucleic acid-binding protein